jgi:hypothetical protein
MKKINEFINNDDELLEQFEILNKELFYETAHLSNMDHIKSSDSYKKILSYSFDILPIVMNEIINNNGNYTLCFIVFDIVGRESINIPESDRGYVDRIKDHIKSWWLENKHRYGK